MPKILIVDDSEIIRAAVRTLFSNGEAEIIEAGDSREALEKYSKQPPDIVLLDIILPGASGLETLKQMRKISAKPVIIMLTAVNQETVNDEATSLGANGIIYKPFDPEHLRMMISKFTSSMQEGTHQ